MHAIHQAKKIIESDPLSDEARVLRELVLALESGEAFVLGKLYDLNYKTFELSLAVLADWRLDRHYASKFRLINAAVHSRTLEST
jgi:hypothetical protein